MVSYLNRNLKNTNNSAFKKLFLKHTIMVLATLFLGQLCYSGFNCQNYIYETSRQLMYFFVKSPTCKTKLNICNLLTFWYNLWTRSLCPVYRTILLLRLEGQHHHTGMRNGVLSVFFHYMHSQVPSLNDICHYQKPCTVANVEGLFLY